MVDFYKDYVVKMFSIEGRTAIVTGATGAWEELSRQPMQCAGQRWCSPDGTRKSWRFLQGRYVMQVERRCLMQPIRPWKNR